MDLIYTNSGRVDQGVLQDYELDLAFGADENNLECQVQAGNHCCEAGSFLYIEGTEYGGIVDSIESKTDSKEVIYRGRTWHGILNSKVLQPDSGEAYLVVTGEANAVLADLLDRMALTDLFEASTDDSGLTIGSYKMNRYIKGYDGIRKMLGTVGGKLKMTFNGGKVVLSAAKIHDYTQDAEFDADQVPFTARRNYKGVNHLICLGSGQLAERMVVNLYADTEGNISQEQTQFGLDEVCAIYEYSNIESEADLIQQGMDEFKSLKATDEISIDCDADSAAFDVGDIIGAVDNITGLSAYTTIAKKIVTIKNGRITVSLSPDTAKAGSSSEVGGGSSGSSSGGVESFNGREGAVVPQEGDYTAAMVGARPDDWMPTAKDVGAAPFVESADFPGCFYRMVDGVQEWLNPPLMDGVEYRTTERVRGNVVYARRFDCGNATNGKIVYTGLVDVGWVRYQGKIANLAMPVNYNTNATASVTVIDDQIKIYVGSSYANLMTKVTVWYTKALSWG